MNSHVASASLVIPHSICCNFTCGNFPGLLLLPHAFTIADVSACWDGEPIFFFTRHHLGLSLFRHESSSKNRQLQIRPRSTTRDFNTIYHFEALGEDKCDVGLPVLAGEHRAATLTP